jgi:hypothetical protein
MRRRTTPLTVAVTAAISNASTRSRFKNAELSSTVTSGYVATKGETRVTGPRPSAAYIDRTAEPFAQTNGCKPKWPATVESLFERLAGHERGQDNHDRRNRVADNNRGNRIGPVFKPEFDNRLDEAANSGC